MAKKTDTPVKAGKFMLELNEGITISNVNEIKKRVVKYFNTNKNLVVKLKQTDQLDLAGIQLLYSLQKSCAEKKKNLKLEIKLSEEAKELLYNSGFNNILEINFQ